MANAKSQYVRGGDDEGPENTKRTQFALAALLPPAGNRDLREAIAGQDSRISLENQAYAPEGPERLRARVAV
jgi:hypothetical protein